MTTVVGCRHLPPGPQPHTCSTVTFPAVGITALRPVPSYTAWWQRHTGVRNLPRVFTPWARPRLEPTTSWLQVWHSVNSPKTPHIAVHSQGLHLREKTLPLKNLPPKMAAAFHGLITNAGLMAAGMSYSYSSQKQTASLYLNIWRHWNGGQSRLNSCVSQFKACN